MIIIIKKKGKIVMSINKNQKAFMPLLLNVSYPQSKAKSSVRSCRILYQPVRLFHSLVDKKPIH